MDNHCVTNSSLCPNTIACPTSTLLCGDLKHCGVSRDECSVFSTRSCPPFVPLLCWDGTTCVYNYDQCPNMSQCPPGKVRCDSGVCRDNVDECIVKEPCPADRPLRCIDGSCSSLVDVSCQSVVTCPPHFTLTTDHRCIPDSLRDSSLVSSSGACPSFMVNCPDGSCALTELLCEKATVCPYGFVLCPDGSCRAHEMMCPSDKDYCLPPMIQCPTKECVKRPEDCSQGIVCPPERPVLCYDRFCYASMRECLSAMMGDIVLYFNASKPPELVDRNGLSNTDSGMIVDPAILEFKMTCPNAYPYYCKSTTQCVSSMDACPHYPPCPSSYPYRCFDGRCVASEISCPSFEEFTNLTRCPYGWTYCRTMHKCVKSMRLCPVLRACASHEFLCSDGSCVSMIGSLLPRPQFISETNVVGNLWYTFFSRYDLYSHMNSMIATLVEQCIFEGTWESTWNSETKGIRESQSLQDTASTIQQRCEKQYNRYPCTEPSVEYIQANQCLSNQKRCMDGRCVGLNEACPSVTVCPRDRPIRCMNNQCVLSIWQCERGTQCPENTVLCEDGSCASSPNLCSSIHCPAELPVLCWDQSCRRIPEDCPKMQSCSDGLYFCSITGRCVYDRTTCTSSSPSFSFFFHRFAERDR